MQCDICARNLHSRRRRPVCVSCARNTLYEPRLGQALALLDRENTHTRAEAMLRPGNDGVIAALPEDTDFDVITAGIHKESYERAQAQRQAAEIRIGRIEEKVDLLRKHIQEQREYIARQKQSQSIRGEQLAAQRKSFQSGQSGLLEPVHSAIKKVSHRLDRTHSKIVDARLLLCREAASASGLVRRKRSDGRSEYMLGGIAIPDLKELNVRTQPRSKQGHSSRRTIAEPYELVSEAFNNVARLVGICSHYLQIKPPAEIILPHESFPRAVIMHEKSSYRTKNLVFPRASTSQSSSPVTSRILDRNAQPSTRPLFLDRPLATLYKDDAKTYGLFVEGVIFLAWDVAWLCRTQGLETVNSFEDLCAVGRNLWHLLMTQPRRSQQSRPGLERNISTTSGRTDVVRAKDEDSIPRLGVYSHASVQHNLDSVHGTALLKDWQLTDTTTVIDRYKTFLINDLSGAEWDILEDGDWVEDRDEKAVFVADLEAGKPQHPAMSVVRVAAPVHDGTDNDSMNETKRKSLGGDGWMKLRGRNGEI